jgi:hypothetical protein
MNFESHNKENIVQLREVKIMKQRIIQNVFDIFTAGVHCCTAIISKCSH